MRFMVICRFSIVKFTLVSQSNHDSSHTCLDMYKIAGENSSGNLNKCFGLVQFILVSMHFTF